MTWRVRIRGEEWLLPDAATAWRIYDAARASGALGVEIDDVPSHAETLDAIGRAAGIHGDVDAEAVEAIAVRRLATLVPADDDVSGTDECRPDEDDDVEAWGEWITGVLGARDRARESLAAVADVLTRDVGDLDRPQGYEPAEWRVWAWQVLAAHAAGAADRVRELEAALVSHGDRIRELEATIEGAEARLAAVRRALNGDDT